MTIPAVTQIAPNIGPITGATLVTLTGTGFTGATGVTFGNTGAVMFKVVSDTQITAVSPPQVGAGFVHVYVQNPSGTSDLTPYDQFQYLLVGDEPNPLPETNPLSEVTQLRLLVGERIKKGKSDTDTFFSDEELVSIINTNHGNLYLAAAQCWDAKAAEYADLVDINESGSDRKLSQMFKSAEKRAEVYRTAGQELAVAFINRVGGRSASILDRSLGGPNDLHGSNVIVDPEFDPYSSPTARWWPPIWGF